jgi:BirA family biotin operon repressor/biotin-[acetyl-CoA-carboxylase] ligase
MSRKPLVKLYDSLDSTQNELKRILQQDAAIEHLSAVVARTQDKGKGRGVSKWHDVPGKSLLMSVFLRWEEPVKESFDVNRWICQALAPVLPDGVLFKWPNDLMVGNFKLGGMLVENHWSGAGIRSSILGLGINILSDAEDLNRAISWSDVVGSTVAVESVQDVVLNALGKASPFIAADSEFRIRYEKLLWGRDEYALYEGTEGEFQALVDGVTPEGKIILQKKNGTRISYDLDAVKWKNPIED